MWSRLKDGASATFVRIGVLGATGILTLFAFTLALDVALTSYVHLGNPSPDVVKGLWVLHNAVFTILLAALAIALFGLSQAAVAGRLIGTRWKAVGIVAPLALLVPVLRRAGHHRRQPGAGARRARIRRLARLHRAGVVRADARGGQGSFPAADSAAGSWSP